MKAPYIGVATTNQVRTVDTSLLKKGKNNKLKLFGPCRGFLLKLEKLNYFVNRTKFCMGVKLGRSR
jgi:hypothetical protein